MAEKDDTRVELLIEEGKLRKMWGKLRKIWRKIKENYVLKLNTEKKSTNLC